MARAARWVYQLILSALLLNRGPEAWQEEPGLQPPAVVHPDDLHGDPTASVEDNRPQVEQAPPPPVVGSPPPRFVSSQAAWHPSDYTPDASAVWIAVERHRRNIAAIAA
jgi:hypothetical protein